MENPGKRNDTEWIERIKAEGAIPLLEPDNCPNGWAIPHGNKFMVRGPEYFSNKVKVPGGDFLLKPLGFDWIKGPAKIGEVLNHPNNRVKKAIDGNDKPFVWAFNIQVPSKDNYSAVAYFVSTEPIPEGSLMDRFLKGDDGFRNSRLKLIANIVKGPWIVRKAVGEQAICLIGRALASFVIEGQTESELLERILGAVRYSELNPTSARPISPPSTESAGNLGPTLRTSLWKSIGQGFLQLLNTGAQESSSLSGSTRANGIVDHKSFDSSSGSKHCNGIVDHGESDEDVK